MIYIGLQSKANHSDDIITKDLEMFNGEIEAFLFIRDDNIIGKVKRNNLSDQEVKNLWAEAWANTEEEAVVMSLCKMLGMTEDNDNGLTVVTTRGMQFGAGAILTLTSDDVPKGKYYAIPSSVHEFLILNTDCGMTSEEVTEIIMQVNTEQVDPKEQLGDHVYEIEIK